MDRDLNAAIDILKIGLIEVGLVRSELTPVEVAEAGSPSVRAGQFTKANVLGAPPW